MDFYTLYMTPVGIHVIPNITRVMEEKIEHYTTKERRNNFDLDYISQFFTICQSADGQPRPWDL